MPKNQNKKFQANLEASVAAGKRRETIARECLSMYRSLPSLLPCSTPTLSPAARILPLASACDPFVTHSVSSLASFKTSLHSAHSPEGQKLLANQRLACVDPTMCVIPQVDGGRSINTLPPFVCHEGLCVSTTTRECDDIEEPLPSEKRESVDSNDVVSPLETTNSVMNQC